MTPLTITRRLDAGERFFWLLDHMSGMNFVVFAEIAGALDAARVRRALLEAQRAHPLLRVKIAAKSNGELWFEPADAPIVFETISVTRQDWMRLVEEELSYAYAAEAAPLMRCRYLPFADGERSVLALTFHHAIADGRSGAALLREILAHALHAENDGRIGEGMVHPPMHAAFPEQFRWDKRPEAAAELAGVRKQELKRHGRPHALEWLNQEQAQRVPRIMRLEFDAAQLLARCRDHGATVHGALGAAQLLAIYAAMGTDEPRTLSLGSPADMRPHLDGAIAVAGLGVYVTLVHSSYRVAPDSPFWDLAREVGADIKRQLARGDGHLLFTQLQPDAFPPTEEGIAAFAKLMLASPQSSMISNIGVVEPVDGLPAVESISFALCPAPYQVLFAAAGTYRGRLLLNLAFDEAKLPVERAERLARSIELALRGN